MSAAESGMVTITDLTSFLDAVMNFPVFRHASISSSAKLLPALLGPTNTVMVRGSNASVVLPTGDCTSMVIFDIIGKSGVVLF
jgi:hypothetical protein